MRPIAFLFGLMTCLSGLLQAQNPLGDVEIKVYDFDDGLSHRNVFKVQQDTSGFIWIATINGLNRFDGYEFLVYSDREPVRKIPHNAIYEMSIEKGNRIWMAHPDYISMLDPWNNKVKDIKIKPGKIVLRESLAPYNWMRDAAGNLWIAVFNERTAQTSLSRLDGDSTLRHVITLNGQYTKRPIAQMGEDIYLGAYENELWRLNEDGVVRESYRFPFKGNDRSRSRVTQIQVTDGILWVLLNDGRVFYRTSRDDTFTPHPINDLMETQLTAANALLVTAKGEIWIGAQGVLLFYDPLTNSLTDYDKTIRDEVKNICNYRQIFQDRSGVVWVASDYGAIKITRSENLFTHYLSEGSEYCSNLFCSTRGITEDEQGRIYFSYYNSIHSFDPRTNSLRLLFPANNFFNYPFGLDYYNNALWTGNGWRIDLATLRIDTLLPQSGVDLGAVLADRNGDVWIGYNYHLYQYKTKTSELTEFADQYGAWDTLAGSISYLYEGRSGEDLWVGTLEKGLYKINREAGRVAHYTDAPDSPARLRSRQINAIYEDEKGFVWLGTGDGLHRLNPQDNTIRIIYSQDGLPNHFINGMLPEGDSVLWVSTDNGLCRFSLNQERCANFFTQDGLSANEFNRISFFKASDGRMYFGGLNGINAFYPNKRFLEHKQEKSDVPLLFTNFTRLDGASDQLIIQNAGLDPNETITLTHNDRFFSISFALADYRNPAQRLYSYKLENYDADWSPPSAVNTVRYNNIPAGRYTFKVRAQIGKDQWNRRELTVPIMVKEAYYRTWQFWTMVIIGLLGGVLAFVRYRIYTIQKRQTELEELVRARTAELEQEKEKSEALLLNILPAETADELKQFGAAKAKRHDMVTVMFSDFQGFSRISEKLEPEELVAEIDYCFRGFDQVIEKYSLEKIKTVGDAYMCVKGISSNENEEDASQVIRAALEIQDFLAQRAEERRAQNLHFFEARIGIHTGSVVAGIVGIKKFAYDIWGDTVNIASRMETYGKVGYVNISEATYLLVKDHFNCKYHSDFSENSAVVRMFLVEHHPESASI
ncbi:MAG: hypothetical protein KDD12_06930 [Lewinella sp.]|nr:hypothetical protein [Lewinella sp.]